MIGFDTGEDIQNTLRKIRKQNQIQEQTQTYHYPILFQYL